jgi:hypothetical protein
MPDQNDPTAIPTLATDGLSDDYLKRRADEIERLAGEFRAYLHQVLGSDYATHDQRQKIAEFGATREREAFEFGWRAGAAAQRVADSQLGKIALRELAQTIDD